MRYLTFSILFLFLFNVCHADNYNKRAEYIATKAKEYGVNPQLALYIADRESSLEPTAKGDNGCSIGVWQIHLPSHPEITTEQAMNFVWSTNWALKELSKGKCSQWSTCPING